MTQAHQDIEDAYVEGQSAIFPSSIKKTLERAASAALKETQDALDLIRDAAGTETKPPFIPQTLVRSTRNKAVLAIIFTAILIAAGLALHDARAFALSTAVMAFTCQQATMVWAIVSSNNPTSSTGRADFYGRLAVLFTFLLVASLLVGGLPIRAALQIAGATFLLVMVEWATVKLAESYRKGQHSDNTN